ncbi:MAG TPA: ABC transporter ATP-binding protein [Candidatus Limnocylindria bacterium]|nr:ABC transporter ATP-binding protein [Candidatus Limnocylindria bacterium]
MKVALDGLTIRFRGGVEAVQDVSLDVASGEFVAIVGPSGCGKSTVLNAIAGLLDPAVAVAEGRIALGGAEVARVARRPDLGYVFQRDALLPWETIEGNVEVGLVIRGMPKAARAARVAELLALAGLSEFAHYYPHQVSGGMRQRASLVRSLAYDPSLILMDEPFGALDAQNRMILQGELMRIWERTDTTILFVTHDLAEAITLAQRVVLFSKGPGRILAVYDIALPHPRDPFELRGTPEFARLETMIWTRLRDEFRTDRTATR